MTKNAYKESLALNGVRLHHGYFSFFRNGKKIIGKVEKDEFGFWCAKLQDTVYDDAFSKVEAVWEVFHHWSNN